MLPSLADRLNTERNRRFVGRKSELELFTKAIAALELPFYLLYIFGPGGVGKTSLLKQFSRLSNNHVKTIYLDARNIDPTPESFINALKVVTSLDTWEFVLQKLDSQSQRQVILLDTYEVLTPLDQWLREVFLPQLPENTLIVIASRQAPSAAWRTDEGWQAFIHTLPLRNLSPDESQSYLTKRDIPETAHQTVVDFTHGYPLALSLIADVFAQDGQISFQLESVPDVIKTLLQKFVQDVPTPAHRMALEACALVRITTEAVLAQMLNMADVHELFAWLRELSSIESGQFGLFPHDLAREVLITDVRWRNTQWYAELHHRARNYYTLRLQQTHGQEQHRILFDYIFLHRDNSAVRPRFVWQENSSLQTDVLREIDLPVLLKIVTEHEGEASAKIAAHWLTRQPQGTIVFRDAQQQVAGFVIMVALHQASQEDLAIDPGAIACQNYLRLHCTPLPPSGGVTLFRFWMARDTYQEVSATQSLIFINFVQHHRLTEELAFTFFCCAKPDFWAEMFAYADLTRLPEADFQVGDRSYGVYGHDWRVLSASAWQKLLAQREIDASAQAKSLPTSQEPLLVLSRAEFETAAQSALRNFARADALHKNPLLRSRLVVEGDTSGMVERIAALQALVQQAVESLLSSPRDEKLYRVLHRTYLQPALTQEQAAELLNLPFSTYRRHLKAGIMRVVDILWQWEIN
ncbi:MAG: ATP-binding protein [Tatlockia sp.]|nr:ATP-binding protein [Tatlockia sp.]